MSSAKNVFEEDGDGKRADATEDRSNGGKIGARADSVVEVTDKMAVFGGGAGIHENSTRRYKIGGKETGLTGSRDDKVKIRQNGEVAIMAKNGNIIARSSPHLY